jgi:beta-lactamase class D
MRILGYLCILCVIGAGCVRNNITNRKDLQKHFDELNAEGTFAVYDNVHNQFEVFSKKKYLDSNYAPLGTFDIVSSLIAFQKGLIPNEKAVVPGTQQPIDSLFRQNDTTLSRALAQLIGQHELQKNIDSLKYSTAKIKSIDGFWKDGNIKITPDVQLGFLKMLYFQKLRGYESRAVNMVKAMMLQESTDKYFLSYKVSTSYNVQGMPIAWVAGWVDKGKVSYFFVLHLTSKTKEVNNYDKAAVTLTKRILSEMGHL